MSLAISEMEKTILIELGKKGEATRYDLSKEGLDYSTVWKTIRKLEGKKLLQETKKEKSQRSPLKKPFYRLTFPGLLTTMALKEAREELEGIAEAQKDLWSLPHELFTCLGEEWREVTKEAISYWCGLASLDKERGREWRKKELEENLLNFLCVLASLEGKEEEFAEKIRKHQKLRRAYIGFLSERIKKLRTYQRLLKMLEGEEKG